MKGLKVFLLIVVLGLVLRAPSQVDEPLRLIPTISIPGLHDGTFDHADATVYDPVQKLYYVGNGGRQAHEDYCLISVIDVKSERKIGVPKAECFD